MKHFRTLSLATFFLLVAGLACDYDRSRDPNHQNTVDKYDINLDVRPLEGNGPTIRITRDTLVSTPSLDIRDAQTVLLLNGIQPGRDGYIRELYFILLDDRFAQDREYRSRSEVRFGLGDFDPEDRGSDVGYVWNANHEFANLAGRFELTGMDGSLLTFTLTDVILESKDPYVRPPGLSTGRLMLNGTITIDLADAVVRG
ncbi:MAG: hypothetical protein SFX74_02175 [Fimbriimonadaceae bacterium]|nr:hypothetical protein [Fimbriimonadaceae bacterium]